MAKRDAPRLASAAIGCLHAAQMSNTYKITVLAGDGIGPEVMAQALRVLRCS